MPSSVLWHFLMYIAKFIVNCWCSQPAIHATDGNLFQLAFTCSKSTVEGWKVTIKTPEWRQWRRSGVFLVHFEHISHLFLEILFLDLEQVNAGLVGITYIIKNFILDISSTLGMNAEKVVLVNYISHVVYPRRTFYFKFLK